MNKKTPTATIPLRKVGECSTDDITPEDCSLLEKQKYLRSSQAGLPQPLENEYGFLIHITQEDLTGQLQRLQTSGFSPQFIHLYETASQQGLEYLLIDQDADPLNLF